MKAGKRLATIFGLAALACAAGLVVMYSGIYNIAATAQHTTFVHWILDVGSRRSIQQRAGEIVPPPLADAALIRTGFQCYQRHCVQCHGAPGVPPGNVGKSLAPLPNNLAQTAREWTAAELYWTTKHGIRMTGMPAWGYRLSEDELWAVVAFLKDLPRLTPQDYQASSKALNPEDCTEQSAAAQADPQRGKLALQQYACVTCHRIPGITGPDAHVGPPLAGIAQRKYLAGVLPNTPENLMRWILNPKAVRPLTAMPDLGVTETHARDIVAYLSTLIEPQTRMRITFAIREHAGRAAIERYGCGVCHAIPGVRGARGRVGPPLDAYGRRVYIAGRFPNEPALLSRWIQDAPSLIPETLMPNVGVAEADARAIAAYLHELR